MLYAPQTQAAENPNQVVLTAEEMAMLQQSLIALTGVLQNLQLALSQTQTLPPNTSQIITALMDINKSLIQISVAIGQKSLAVSANPLAPKVPVAVVDIEEKSKAVSEKSDELAFSKSDMFAEENEPVVENENGSSLLAAVKFLFNPKIGGIVVIILLIGAVAFWRTREKFETEKSQSKPA